MARKKELINPVLISLQVEKEDYDKLNTRVPNVSKFIREFIQDYVSNDNLSLAHLYYELEKKKNKLKVIDGQILELENKIKKQEDEIKRKGGDIYEIGFK